MSQAVFDVTPLECLVRYYMQTSATKWKRTESAKQSRPASLEEHARRGARYFVWERGYDLSKRGLIERIGKCGNVTYRATPKLMRQLHELPEPAATSE